MLVAALALRAYIGSVHVIEPIDNDSLRMARQMSDEANKANKAAEIPLIQNPLRPKFISLDQLAEHPMAPDEKQKTFGSKAVHLGEMMRMGLRVPPGIAISSEWDSEGEGPVAQGTIDEIIAALEGLTGRKFSDPEKPLSVSVRPSLPISKPGMVDTVLGVQTKSAMVSAISTVLLSWTRAGSQYAGVLRGLNDQRPGIVVQMMVQGDKNEESASGVFFSRDVLTGADVPSGRFAIRTRGIDIVSRIAANTLPLAKMQHLFPRAYEELIQGAKRLENKFQDVQDIEFTIEDGTLWFLQDRNAEATPDAKAIIASAMVSAGILSPAAGLIRLKQAQAQKQQHQLFRIRDGAPILLLGRGTPSSAGAVQGPVVFTLEESLRQLALGRKPILVVSRHIQDIQPAILRHAASGILTQYGHEALHESVLARSQGIPMIDGLNAAVFHDASLTIGTHLIRAGDEILIDGVSGCVYAAADPGVLIPDRMVQIEGIDTDLEENAMKTRRQYADHSYEELLPVYRAQYKVVRSFGEKITAENIIDNNRLTTLHTMLAEKGQAIGKNYDQVLRDIHSPDQLQNASASASTARPGAPEDIPTNSPIDLRQALLLVLEEMAKLEKELEVIPAYLPGKPRFTFIRSYWQALHWRDVFIHDYHDHRLGKDKDVWAYWDEISNRPIPFWLQETLEGIQNPAHVEIWGRILDCYEDCLDIQKALGAAIFSEIRKELTTPYNEVSKIIYWIQHYPERYEEAISRDRARNRPKISLVSA